MYIFYNTIHLTYVNISTKKEHLLANSVTICITYLKYENNIVGMIKKLSLKFMMFNDHDLDQAKQNCFYSRIEFQNEYLLIENTAIFLFFRIKVWRINKMPAQREYRHIHQILNT